MNDIFHPSFSQVQGYFNLSNVMVPDNILMQIEEDWSKWEKLKMNKEITKRCVSFKMKHMIRSISFELQRIGTKTQDDVFSPCPTVYSTSESVSS